MLNSFTTPAAAEKKLLAVNTRQATADAVVQYAQAAQALLGPSPLEVLPTYIKWLGCHRTCYHSVLQLQL